MRNSIFISLLFVSSFFYSQDLTGKWYGAADIMGKEFPIGIDFSKNDNTIEAILFNTENGSDIIPFDSVEFLKDKIYLSQKRIGFVFNGKFKNDSIIGIAVQNGLNIPLVLTKNILKKKEVKRPQTPIAPFDYYIEEISVIKQEDSIKLSGTLTLPDSSGQKVPIVILISGSGAQNRDSEILGHKSFAVIADHLAKQGIGSFRYDERGVKKSTGRFQGSDLHDFYSDLDAIVQVISKRKETKKLGLAGHSEGGILAPWYASEHKKAIDFVIMMGAPGIPPSKMMHLQRENVYKDQGLTPQEIEREKQLFLDIDEIVINNEGAIKTEKLKALFTNKANELNYDKSQLDQYLQLQMGVMNGAWYKSFISVVPESYLKKVRCSALAIGGGKDIQVPMEVNMKGIASGLAKSKPRFLRKRILQYSKFGSLNHLMQPCETGMPAEYGAIETTISRDVLFCISDFINGL